MSSNNALRKARHEAYEKKEEKKGARVVMWIFVGLIVLGLLYMIWTFSQI